VRKITRPIRLSLLLIVACAVSVSAQRGRGGAPPAPTAPTPPGPPRVEQLKREAAAEVETMRVMTQQMVDQVFSYGELGFQETETSRYLTDILQQNGFKIERAYAGIPTAWVATWGSGKPVIAIGSDIDCIPQASQKPGVAYHDPLIEGAPGHGEGHNSGVPLNITATLAVKKPMERERLPGTLKLWPGVAEELVGAKAYFIRAGLFRDVDVSLFAHVGANLGGVAKQQSTSLSIENAPNNYFAPAAIPGVEDTGSFNLDDRGVAAGPASEIRRFQTAGDCISSDLSAHVAIEAVSARHTRRRCNLAAHRCRIHGARHSRRRKAPHARGRRRPVPDRDEIDRSAR